MHYLEAWNEAVCDGAWGSRRRVLGEKLRQALDLEHWAAFGESLERMMGIVRAVGTGERGEPPASIVALSGDVHHAYLAEVGFPPGTGMRSTACQATCSPFRNPLDDKRAARSMRFMASEPARRGSCARWRAPAGVGAADVRWRFAHDEPWFDNQVCYLELDGRARARGAREDGAARGRARGRRLRARARVRARPQLTHRRPGPLTSQSAGERARMRLP